MNAELVAALRAALARHADPVRAEGLQAYMKSTMPYLGLRLETLRAACNEVLSLYRLDEFDSWRETVLALWHDARYREERYAALELLGDRRYKAYRTLDALPLYEELIVSGAWWDLVDGVASHEVGDLLREHPAAMKPRLLAWSRGEDMWLRRTAIICQIGSKHATDTELLFECIEPSLGSKEFFLRKAIGWALREHAKVAPDVVLRYVQEHDKQLSGLSKREALKHIPPIASAKSAP
jgi:3-methyladenine DNA glycosylase AlkD